MVYGDLVSELALGHQEDGPEPVQVGKGKMGMDAVSRTNPTLFYVYLKNNNVLPDGDEFYRSLAKHHFARRYRRQNMNRTREVK